MLVKNLDMLSKLVCVTLGLRLIDLAVRLANRLKALSTNQYSSDEETEDTNGRRSSLHADMPHKRNPSFNGAAAFAEVVRATMKVNQEAIAAAKNQ
jgi:adenylosuccinate lyase